MKTQTLISILIGLLLGIVLSLLTIEVTAIENCWNQYTTETEAIQNCEGTQ